MKKGPWRVWGLARWSPQRGAAMMLTWMVMSLLLCGALVSTGLRMADLRRSGSIVRGKRARYCAEAGLSAARDFFRAIPGQWSSYLQNDTPFVGRASLPDGSGMDYSVRMSDNRDEFPQSGMLADPNESNIDRDQTVMLTSTCVDPALNMPVMVRSYLTMNPINGPGGGMNTARHICLGAGCQQHVTTRGGPNGQGGTTPDIANIGGVEMPVGKFSGGDTLNADGSMPGGTKFNADGIKAAGLDLRNDQLVLSTTFTTLPFIWMSNSGEGTVSKINTETGVELGRYRTGPGAGNPSRTTVDLDGNVWVGNRANNTVTKIGLREANNCIDRNNNGTIDTSTGGTDVKPWSGSWGSMPNNAKADECILAHVEVEAPGADTPNDIRMVTVDKNNFLFTGGLTARGVYKLDPSGAIVAARNSNHGHYGALVDGDNNLWTMVGGGSKVEKMSNDLTQLWNYSIQVGGYGMGIDAQGYIYTSEYGNRWSAISKTGVQKFAAPINRGICCGQGVAVTQSNELWLAGSLASDHVDRYSLDGTFLARYTVGRGPTGVAVDSAGKIWSSNYYGNSTSRIDPATGRIDTFKIGANPYNYSDMTGFIARTFTSRQGTYTIRQYCGRGCNFWKSVSWVAGSQPPGTTISARARTANSELGLGASVWKPAGNGQVFPQDMDTGLPGRVIEVELKLTTNTDGVTPRIDQLVVLSWSMI